VEWLLADTHIFPKVMHLFFKTEFQEDICHKKFILKQKRKHKLIDNENDTTLCDKVCQ
jgi:hypothetical protein